MSDFSQIFANTCQTHFLKNHKYWRILKFDSQILCVETIHEDFEPAPTLLMLPAVFVYFRHAYSAYTICVTLVWIYQASVSTEGNLHRDLAAAFRFHSVFVNQPSILVRLRPWTSTER